MSKSVLSKYPEYEVVIGCETHVQLKTKSKMFCSCANIFGADPNSNICRVCTGMLGTLPTINLQAINYAITAGLATNSQINKLSEFARKHYNYPDLPKNYQITQDDKPICSDGYLEIEVENSDSTKYTKKINIKRIHLEEDAGKLIHGEGSFADKSFLDLNRAGTPLIEVVTEPDMKSADEAVAYLETLKTVVEYTGISSANMEEGSFRADVNISVKLKTAQALGTKVELKNINSFRFIHNAIEFEIERQIELIKQGEKVKQETRLWDSERKETFFMRSKENAEDYRYLPDPDLPLVVVDSEWVDRIASNLPELPKQKLLRFINEYGVTEYEAEILCSDRLYANYFEEVVQICRSPKRAANWILRDLLGYLKEHNILINQILITPNMLAELIIELDKGVINSSVAQNIFLEMAETGKYPSIIIEEKGLKQINDKDVLLTTINTVIQEFPNQSDQFRNGNERIFGFLVGQAMKKLQGKADPVLLSTIFKEELLKK